MKYTVLVERKVQVKLKILPVKIRKNIFFRIQKLENFNSSTPNVKKLKRPLQGYRLRVGDYRILFTSDTNKKVIKVYTLDHRKDVYR